MTSIKLDINPGSDERDMVIDNWYRNCCMRKYLVMDVKSIIQLYSCPIPFHALNSNISYELIPNKKGSHLYSFERINDIFDYIENERKQSSQDVIYHPLQPVIPDTITINLGMTYSWFSNITTLSEPNISFRQLFLKKENGYNKPTKYFLNHHEMFELWRCKNGKQDFEFDIIEINPDHTIKCKFIDEENELEEEKTYILSNDLFDVAQEYIESGVDVSEISVSIVSAPLRLPKEKYICVISLVTAVGWLHTVD